MNPRPAHLNRHPMSRSGIHSPANTVPGFEEEDILAQTGKIPCATKTSEPSADNDDIVLCPRISAKCGRRDGGGLETRLDLVVRVKETNGIRGARHVGGQDTVRRLHVTL
jgi:hypothetical protein